MRLRQSLSGSKCLPNSAGQFRFSRERRDPDRHAVLSQALGDRTVSGSGPAGRAGVVGGERAHDRVADHRAQPVAFGVGGEVASVEDAEGLLVGDAEEGQAVDQQLNVDRDVGADCAVLPAPKQDFGDQAEDGRPVLPGVR